MCRELKEELDIEVRRALLIKKFKTNVNGLNYELSIFSIVKWAGKCIGLEGQILKWVSMSKLSNYNMHGPNKNIIASLMLPNKIMITPYLDGNYPLFLKKLDLLKFHDIELLQLRLTRDESINKLVSKKIRRDYFNKIKIMINGRTSDFDADYFDGVHLPFYEAKKLNARPVKKTHLFSVSCHNKEEIEHANLIDPDFVYLSPINKTMSHPNLDSLGWFEAEKIAATSKKPVYALGGVSIADAPRAIEKGFQGIAGITTFWGNVYKI